MLIIKELTIAIDIVGKKTMQVNCYHQLYGYQISSFVFRRTEE